MPALPKRKAASPLAASISTTEKEAVERTTIPVAPPWFTSNLWVGATVPTPTLSPRFVFHKLVPTLVQRKAPGNKAAGSAQLALPAASDLRTKLFACVPSVILTPPTTCNLLVGATIPIPTLPLFKTVKTEAVVLFRKL